MSYTITFATQKGGAAKTTSAAITADLLSELGKVLVVDLDSQGNLTEIFTMKPIRQFRLEGIGGVLDALKDNNAKKYILRLTDNLHLLPGTEYMGLFPRWLWNEYNGNKQTVLKDLLDQVKDYYDFIVLDTPPALGDILISALIASNGVVIMFDTGQFSYSAIASFLETVDAVNSKGNPQLKPLGILCTMLDLRRGDNIDFIKMVHNNYKELVFETKIKRQAAIGRIAFSGFFDNAEKKTALEQYRPFIEELIARGPKATK